MSKKERRKKTALKVKGYEDILCSVMRTVLVGEGGWKQATKMVADKCDYLEKIFPKDKSLIMKAAKQFTDKVMDRLNNLEELTPEQKNKWFEKI